MSYSQYLKHRAIRTGTEWRLKITINSSAVAVFEPTAKFAAQFRTSADSEKVLASLTTEAGKIIRVNNNTLEIVLDGAASANWESGKVVMDIVRTDTASNVHLGFDLEIPVKRSVTRV